MSERMSAGWGFKTGPLALIQSYDTKKENMTHFQGDKGGGGAVF